MPGRIALQSTAFEILQRRIPVSRKLWECARVLAALLLAMCNCL
jgi:hypothetical protein